MGKKIKQKKTKSIGILRLMWETMSRGEKTEFLFLMLLGIISAVAVLIPTQVISLIVSKLSNESISVFGITIPDSIGYGTIILVGAIITFSMRTISVTYDLLIEKMVKKVVADIRKTNFDWLVAPRKNMDLKMTQGDAIYRLNQAPEIITDVVVDLLCSVIPEILSAALALVYLIFLDASTIVVLACGVAVVCACVVARIKIEKKISFRTERAKSAMSSTLANTISNLPIIYLYKSMMFESSIYRDRTDNFLKEQKRQINLRWFYWLGVRIAQVTCVFVIIYLCAKQVYLGTMLVGNVIIVVNYVAQLFSPIQSVGYFAARWINCLVSVERLVELKPNENELLPLESESMSIETIELKNISAENGKFNLNNVNLKFKKDELVVVTGESGCGKSTLIKVICGLCEKNSGDIVINGSKKLDSGYTAVENMSVAMQSAYIFNRDVKLNVLYPDGVENENFKKVINELSLTGVVGRKYDVAEEQTLENMLSGGEKKRIGLSRTLIKKADVYIFDEPTNDLDNSNAKKVIQSIEKLKKDAIVIVVSHDDRVKKIADRLIEFEERGKIKDEKNETSNRD